jgi:hypothetical protein
MTTRPLNTFDFINNSMTRFEHETALTAITQLELWDFIKNFSEGQSFTFSRQPEIPKIYERIQQLGYTGHSGASFGCIMRSMEYIALYGIDSYKQIYRNINTNV